MQTVINTSETNTPKTVEKKKTVFKAVQVIWLLTGLVETILLLRLIFRMLAANQTGFVNMIYQLSRPLLAPFAGIFGPSVTDRSVLEWSTIVAMGIYVLIAYGLVAVMRLMKPVNVAEAEQV